MAGDTAGDFERGEQIGKSMNIVSQRDKIKQMAAIGVFGKMRTQILTEALISPLFCDKLFKGQLSKEESEWVLHDICTEVKGRAIYHPRVSPFKTFCVYDESVDQFLLASRLIDNCHELWMAVIDDGKGLVTKVFSNVIDDYCFVEAWADGKKVEMNDERKGMVPKVSETIMLCLVGFIGRAMLPNNVAVSVSPKAKGKSVEWTLSRTHYLTLNPHQARLCQKQSRGPTDSELTRSAHWRRSHFRRLRSEKFKNRKGSLIPVRQAWVGPTEWHGIDGKVYRLASSLT